MKSVLFVATIYKHFLAFHIPYMKMLKDNGYRVYCAANGSEKIPYVDGQFNICVQRNPFNIKNICAIRELESIIAEYNIDLVHCHTAMGAVVARLASKDFRKHGLKVIYTVHGFHFFKGSPFSYWLLFYPIEKFLSRYTDALVLINKEDYELVLKNKFKNRDTYFINGVGVNTERFTFLSDIEKGAKRKELGLKFDDVVFIYVAEFIPRKNHMFLISNIKELLFEYPNLKLLLAGRGILLDKIKKYVEKNKISDNVKILGFRKDIGDLMSISDIGVSVSKQEGLPMNVAEEMYMGLPMLVSDIRGNRDLVINGKNGLLFKLGDNGDIKLKIRKMIDDKKLREEMSLSSKEIVKDYILNVSLLQMKSIYDVYL